LRQHNGEISGGAHATRDRLWVRAAHVAHFPDWPAALQFEWRWKQLSRKIQKKTQDPLLKRMHALKELLALPQSTTHAVPYKDWPTPPEIVFGLPEAETMYHSLQ